MSYNNRGLYFEEFKLDEPIITQGRTVTEADIVNFCGFTGDWSQLHTNIEYAKTIPFKQRIAHGMLTFSMGTGLAVLTGMLKETIVAFEGVKEWSFKRPVFIGDTVHVEMHAVKKELRKLRGGFEAGQVTIKAMIKNQHGKICQEGLWSMLISLKGNEKPTDKK